MNSEPRDPDDDGSLRAAIGVRFPLESVRSQHGVVKKTGRTSMSRKETQQPIPR